MIIMTARLSGMLTVSQTLQGLPHLFLKNKNKQNNEVAAIMLTVQMRKLMLNEHECPVQITQLRNDWRQSWSPVTSQKLYG